MTVESATIPATDVTAWLTHDPANDPSLGAGWQTTGSGDAYRVAMAENGPTWKLLAKDGVFAVCQTNVCSGEISFRVKFLRDYNEHGLSVAAFAGDSSVAVTATDNGPNGETLAGLPVWMKVHVSRTTITRSVSCERATIRPEVMAVDLVVLDVAEAHQRERGGERHVPAIDGTVAVLAHHVA